MTVVWQFDFAGMVTLVRHFFPRTKLHELGSFLCTRWRVDFFFFCRVVLFFSADGEAGDGDYDYGQKEILRSCESHRMYIFGGNKQSSFFLNACPMERT